MTKNETKLIILSLLFTGGIVSPVLWWVTNRLKQPLDVFLHPIKVKTGQDKMSSGEKILVTAETSDDKQAGVQAFAQGDFATAITKFQSSLRRNRNDPEALIYLNNAYASKSNAFLKIAVSLPIGSNLNVAQEILRGVAQAQEEVNRGGGINGKLLQVEIANDDNKPDIAKGLAADFVADTNILAVVGHNASDASLAACPVYQQGKLVMISPTS